MKAPIQQRLLKMLFFLDYEDPTGGSFINSPGLLPLIGHVRNQGFQIDFIANKNELYEAIKKPDIDVVGISSMERLLHRTIPIARKVREARPDVIMMIGGNALSPFVLDLAGGLFDIAVLGEAEHTLPAMLREIAKSRCLQYDPHPDPDPQMLGQPQKVSVADKGGALTQVEIQNLFNSAFPRPIPGPFPDMVGISNVFIRDSHEGVVWKIPKPEPEDPSLIPYLDPAPFNEELDETFVMPWDVIEKEGWKHLELYVQRGCRWGRCHFCSVADRAIRVTSPKVVVDTIEEASKRGAEVISFADDLFVQRPKWNSEVLGEIVNRNIKISLTAQTMATRSVWSLLDQMKQSGFYEMCFGVETLDPNRAQAMRKSFNGRLYVTHAQETVRRTAEAGIFPLLYLIMVDPNSTLKGIVRELVSVLKLIENVYRHTGVAPKPSYSLMMLPVACTSVVNWHECTSNKVSLGQREIEIPAEFLVSPDIANYLSKIDKATNGLRYPRENLAAFEHFLTIARDIAKEMDHQDREDIETHASEGLTLFHKLCKCLDQDAHDTANLVYTQIARGEGVNPLKTDYRRFGGYYKGMAIFYQRLQALMNGKVEIVNSNGHAKRGKVGEPV